MFAVQTGWCTRKGDPRCLKPSFLVRPGSALTALCRLLVAQTPYSALSAVAAFASCVRLGRGHSHGLELGAAINCSGHVA